MTSRENVEFVTSIFDEWKHGNFAASARLLAPDIVVTWEEPAGTTVCHGPEEVAEHLRAFLEQWTDFRADIEEIRELDEDHVLVATHEHATGKRSGIDLDAIAYIVFGLRHREVASVHWYFDRAKALEAAGLSE